MKTLSNVTPQSWIDSKNITPGGGEDSTNITLGGRVDYKNYTQRTLLLVAGKTLPMSLREAG